MATEPHLPLLRLDDAFADEGQPRLGAVLLKSRMLRPEQLDDALAEQRKSGKRLGEVLIDRGWLFPQDVARALAVQQGLDYVDIQVVSVDPRAASTLDPEIGERLCAVPVRYVGGGGVLVAVADPTSDGLSEIRQAIAAPVSFAVSEALDIRNAWRLLLRGYRP